MNITPNTDQFVAYAQSEHEGEVVMVNMLKFKERSTAVGTGADNAISGETAYRRYGEAVTEMIENQGGRILWMGRPIGTFIGDADSNDWDAVALVSYPSRQSFIEMVSSPDYKSAHDHREDGLADMVVIACAPSPAFLTKE